MSDGKEDETGILLAFACPALWKEMTGDKRIRICERCSCKVQNVDRYSQEQIADVQRRVDAGEQICVAFTRRNIAPIQVSPDKLNAGEGRAKDWRDMTEFSEYNSSFGQSKFSSTKKISIAVAASVTLACVQPAPYSVLAQSPYHHPNDSHPFSNTFDNIKTQTNEITSKTIKTISECHPGDKVKVDPMEHGMIAGRPAPSIVRDLVNELGGNVLQVSAPENLKSRPQLLAFSRDLQEGFVSRNRVEALAREYRNLGPNQVSAPENLKSRPQLLAFSRDLQEGFVSRNRVEALAREYRNLGPNPRAEANCYRLLIELAKRDPVSPDKLKGWQQQANNLSLEEYNQAIAAFEKNLRVPNLHAMDYLVQANNARRSNPQVLNRVPWSEISKRFDKLRPEIKDGLDCHNFVFVALSEAGKEPQTASLRAWLQGIREYAWSSFREAVLASDKYSLKRDFPAAFKQLSDADLIGTTDLETSQRCDWPSVVIRLKNLEPYLDSSMKELCAELIREHSRPKEAPQ